MSYDNLNDPSQDDENKNLIINYIPSSMSENDILEVFKQYGEVINFKLVCDKISHVSLGYAFCKYSNTENAQLAIEKLNGSKLLDKTLKVSISKKKPEQTTLYVAGYPFSFTKEDLEGIFVPFGAIKESKLLFQPDGKSKGVGFITYENGTSAFNALTLNGAKPPGCPKPLQVKLAPIKVEEHYGKNGKHDFKDRKNSYSQQPGLPQVPAYNKFSNQGYNAPNMGSDNSQYGKAPYVKSNVAKAPYDRPVVAQQPVYPYSNAAMHPMLSYGMDANGHMVGMINPMAMQMGQMAGMPTSMLLPGQNQPQYMMPQANPYQPLGGYVQPTQQVSSSGGRAGEHCVFIYHLPPAATEDQLYALFASYGQVSSAKVVKDNTTGQNKGFGFVNYTSPEHADLAIKNLNNFPWDGKKLKVSLKSDKPKNF